MANYLLQYLIIASATLALVSASEFKRYFIDREQNFTDFEVYSHNVAESIKNLKVTTSKNKVELGIMGYEFVNKIHDGIYYLNKAVIHIKHDGFHDKLEKSVNKLSDIVNHFQSKIHSSDPNEIKEKLVYSIDAILEVCRNILELVEEYKEKISRAVYKPFQVGVQRVLFSIQQLKYQADFFEKDNEQLSKEGKNSLTMFMKTLTGITSESDELRKELQYQIIQLEHIVDKTVLKLESWIQLNSNETDKVKTIKEASKEMSAMYERLHRLANSHHTVAYVTSHFGPVYRDFNMLIKSIGHLDTEENSGNQEYLRAILINSVALSNLYSNELGYLSKNETVKGSKQQSD